MARKTYSLYVVRPEDISEKERYFLITPDWTLLYTDKKPPERNIKVTDLSKLPTLAVDWLNSTIEKMRAEYLADNAKEILQRGKAFNDRFAEELKAERKNMEKENAGND